MPEETEKHYTDKRYSKRVRNLKQYRDLSDVEFDEKMAEYEMNAQPSMTLERRIDAKLSSFTEDYDLTDLKINDQLVLRALIQAILQLEDLEQVNNNIRGMGVSLDNITILRELNNMMSSLRKDISSMQEDLKITRRHRKGDKEQSVINYLEDLKIKAKEFYKSRMAYVYCPECKMLLGTVWFNYPESKKTVLKFKCEHDLPSSDGKVTKCGTYVEVTPVELMEKGGTNITNVPETFK